MVYRRIAHLLTSTDIFKIEMRLTYLRGHFVEKKISMDKFFKNKNLIASFKSTVNRLLEIVEFLG